MPFKDAVAFVSSLLEDEPAKARTLYFVNAHTLNLAYENAAYRAVLDRADYVLGDGTGVRWARAARCATAGQPERHRTWCRRYWTKMQGGDSAITCWEPRPR